MAISRDRSSEIGRVSPFTKAIGLPRVRAHWVRPEIVVDVGFIEWTVHGKLRHPRLLNVVEPRMKQITDANLTP